MNKTRPQEVRPIGKLTSLIALVGEAPGKWEHVKGVPFVGPSGQMIRRMAEPHGLDRSSFYITNVYPYWPDHQGLKIKDLEDNHELEPHIDKLHERLDEMPHLRVVVPTGNIALRALTGKTGITKWRGSILEYTTLSGRNIKVIPTIHPAAIMRNWQWFKRTCLDWKKIASEVNNPGAADLPEFSHLIRPSLPDLQDFVTTVLAKPTLPLSLDIETPGRDGVITCIGFSNIARESVVIPTTKDYWGSKKKYEECWDIVKTLTTSPCPKVMQNGLFDSWVLTHNYNIKPANWVWDTLAMHTCLDPIDSHDLGYIASLYTNQPYWKNEGKQYISARRMTSRIENFWIYCGLDASITLELQQKLLEELKKQNLLDVYMRHYADIFYPCLDLSLTGIKVNEANRLDTFVELRIKQHTAMQDLAKLAGRPMHAKDGLSPKRLASFLYTKTKGNLGLPPMTTPDGKISTDEAAIKKLLRRYSSKFKEVGNLILTSRRTQKLASFLGPKTYCPDGRMRSTYTPFASSGRMRCKSTPNNTGRNAQNTDHEVRQCYVPEEGCVFLQVDLSQAESRIVQALTGTDRMIERARKLPGSWDEHTYNASEIFEIPEDQITKPQRQIGKRVTHSTNYGVGPTTLSNALFLEGYNVPPKECKALLDKRKKNYPEIMKWQQSVRKKIMNDSALVNSWGRRMDFTYSRMSHDTYKEAYAFIPQSEIADLTNQWGFKELHDWIREDGGPERRQTSTPPYVVINAHMHDGLLISVEPDFVWTIANMLKQWLERPRIYQGVELSIPVTYSLGPNWGTSTVEYKSLPDHNEMLVKAHEILEETTR